VEEEVWSIK